MDTTTESFFDHLKELRQRLIYCVITVVIAFAILWVVRDDLIELLAYPLKKVIDLQNGQIILLSVMDKIYIHMKTVFLSSLILSTPVILLQVWKFVVPALYTHERNISRVFFVSSVGLFAAGVSLCYFAILPLAFSFLLKYSTAYEGFLFQSGARESLQIHLKEHLRLTLNLMFVFGVIFELPLVMIFLSRLGIVEIAVFKRMRKHALIVSMIFSAVLTPPDPLTMIGLAIPMILLYEVGILLCVHYGAAKGPP